MVSIRHTAVWFLAGVLVGKIVAATPMAMWITGVGAVSVFLWLLIRRYAIISMCWGFGILGAWCGYCDTVETVPSQEPDRFASCFRVIQGTVEDVPFFDGERTRLTMRLSGVSECMDSRDPPIPQPDSGRVYVTVRGDASLQIFRGDVVRLATRLSRRQHHVNTPLSLGQTSPSVVSYTTMVTPKAFEVLRRRRIEEVFLVPVRRRIAAYWRALSGDARGLAMALTLGQSRAVSQETRALFRDTGVAHLLAVSGLHLGIIGILLFATTWYIVRQVPFVACRINTRIPAGIITLIGLVGFTLLTGARPPVLRACTMAGLYILSTFISRRSNPLDSLSLCLVLLVAWKPSYLFTPGVQLSFVTVFCLIRCLRAPVRTSVEHTQYPPVQSRLGRLRSGAVSYFYKAAIASLVASVATWPILAWHFGTLCLTAPIINVAAIPIASFIVMPCLIALSIVVLVYPAAAHLLIPLAQGTLDGFVWSIQKLSMLTIPLEVTTWHAGLLLGLGCGVLLAAIYKRGWWTAVGIGKIALVVAVIRFAPLQTTTFPADALTLDFLDVGQGDSTLITFPDGTHWLVDAGGTAHRDIGRDHIVPVLERLGVTALEKLILTHPDPDHLAGMTGVLERFTPAEIWDNGQGLEEPASPEYAVFLDLARRQSVPVKRGKVLCGKHEKGNVTWEVLHPCLEDMTYDPYLSFNDNSIVLRLTYKKTRVLLTGDLSHAGESILMDDHDDLKSDVLKLGHHGSGSSTTDDFVSRVAPVVAVASCGRDNGYGFPHPQVLKNLVPFDTVVYRTDTMGKVRIVVAGGPPEIETAKKP